MRTDYTCQGCGRTGFPEFTMGQGNRMVASCSFCQREEPSLGPTDFSRGLAAPAPNENGAVGWAGRTPVEVELDAAQPRQMSFIRPAAPMQAPAARPEPLPASYMAPDDVMGWLETTITTITTDEAKLEGQIAEAKARLAGLRAQRNALQRMLQAGRVKRARRTPRLAAVASR